MHKAYIHNGDIWAVPRLSELIIRWFSLWPCIFLTSARVKMSCQAWTHASGHHSKAPWGLLSGRGSCIVIDGQFCSLVFSFSGVHASFIPTGSYTLPESVPHLGLRNKEVAGTPCTDSGISQEGGHAGVLANSQKTPLRFILWALFYQRLIKLWCCHVLRWNQDSNLGLLTLYLWLSLALSDPDLFSVLKTLYHEDHKHCFL